MDTAVLSRRRLLGRSLASSAVAAMAALGIDLRPTQARAWALRIAEVKPVPSVCPYCAVGCDTDLRQGWRHPRHRGRSQLSHQPGHPLPQGRGHLPAPRQPQPADAGALPPSRRHRVGDPGPGRGDGHGRRAGENDPRRDLRGDLPGDQPRRRAARKIQMASLGIFSLGGATMDNEWNHIQQKLMRGLGVVAIENQARI